MPIPPEWYPRRTDLRALLTLAIPVVVIQVGMMFMGVVDTLMVGRVSPLALASVAIGNLYGMVVTIFAQGVLLAIDPVVTQAVGANDRPAIAHGVQRALVLAALLTVPVSLSLLCARPILGGLRQQAEIVPLASSYATLLIPGVFPFLLFSIGRQTLQALGRLKPIVVTIIAANLANILLNWVLIFGKFGAPALGVAGSSIATSVSRWLMAIGLLAWGWPDLRPFFRPWLPESFRLAPLLRMTRLGLPIGLQFVLEYGAFGAVALLAGVLGTVQVAAYQIAINLASITYMVPLGVSAAATVMVGRAVGREAPGDARRQAVTALLCGAGFMVTTATLFLLLPGTLARLYTTDPATIALAASLIPLAGLFQVFDGTQITAIGVLRGVGDTRTPFLVSLMGYWLIGIPVSLLLGLKLALGAVGLWWGLVVGLAAVALILLARVRRTLRGPLGRLHIDTPLLEAEAGVHSIPLA